MKILIIAPRFPFPIEKGDKLRLYHQIRVLSASHSIELIALSDQPVEDSSIGHLSRFVDKIHVFRLKKSLVYLNILLRFFSGLPLQVLYFHNRSIAKKVKSIIKRSSPDVIYNQLIRTTEYSRHIKCKKVLDYMDAFSTGMANRLDNSTIPFKWIYAMEQKRLAKYEQSIYSHFDAHLIISEQDQKRIVGEQQRQIHVIPNGVDTEYFSPLMMEEEYDICFVGNMGYRPNIIAAEYIGKSILPRLRKRNPEIRVLIAGARPHTRVKNLENENLHVSGWMNDIREAYGCAKVFIAPIFTGIGQQNKVLEAMSMEKACVCTSSVNYPIGSEHGREVLVADTNDEFISNIELLLDDDVMRKSLGERSRNFVLKNYSWEGQVKKLKNILEEV